MLDLFLPLAFMLSPGALIAVGNGIGMSGMLFGVFLILASACALLTSNGMGKAAEGNGAYRFTRALGLGYINAARLLALVCFATRWLAEAGYSFNELFANWYPSLACSLTLLGLILAISLLKETYRGVVLYIAALICLAIVGYISAMATQPHGIEAWFPTMFPQKTPPFFPTGGDFVQGAYLAFLALLGFDLATRPDAGKGASRSAMAILLVVCVYLLYLWGGLSAADPFDMARSTIPHLLMAGISLGERGKLVMTGAVMLGTCSSILALLCVGTRQFQYLFNRKDNELLRRLVHVLLSAGIAAMLVLGWAVKPELETLLAGAIVCWFAGYALINCSLILRGTLQPLAVTALLFYIFAAWMAYARAEDLRYFAYTVGSISVAAICFLSYHIKQIVTESQTTSQAAPPQSSEPTKK